MTKKRAIGNVAIALIIIVIILVAAVGVYYYTAKPAPTQHVNLTLITFADPANAWMSWAAQQFDAAHPGVNITIDPQPFGSYISKETTSLQTHSSQYDIIGFTSTSAGSVQPYLVDLSQYFTINSSDIPETQLAFGGLWVNGTKTTVIGVPWDSATFTIFYRTDIMDNPTLNASFYQQYGVSLDPHAWRNWTDVLNADYFLVNQTHTVPYGIITDAQQAHDIIDTFPAIFGWWYARNPALNAGTVGGLNTFNIMFQGSIPAGFMGKAANSFPPPSFNNSDGVAALQTFYKLVRYDPQPFTEINYGTIWQQFAQLHAAGAIMFTPENSNLGNITGKYSVAPLPGGYAETGTDFFGVSKYSQNPQIAAEFIQYLISAKVNANLYYMTGEFPISKAAVGLINSNSSVTAWQKQLVDDVYQTSQVAWANPPNTPNTYGNLITDFNGPVYNYLIGNDPSAAAAMQALNTAAANWIKDLTPH